MAPTTTAVAAAKHHLIDKDATEALADETVDDVAV